MTTKWNLEIVPFFNSNCVPGPDGAVGGVRGYIVLFFFKVDNVFSFIVLFFKLKLCARAR